jgi:glycosyltransferase involved in cell wall biosynthesis
MSEQPESGTTAAPKVSIIIPVYNVEEYLVECLDSVINQTLQEIEIICVNDGSTDTSREILAQYALRDPRITIIDQENSGQSAARNRGIDSATGEYIYFLDSDDFIDINTCQIVYDAALVHPGGFDFVGFGGNIFADKDAWIDQAGFSKEFYYRKNNYAPNSGKNLACNLVLNGDYIVSATMYFSKRSHLQDFNIRFEEGLLYEDNWFTYLNIMSAKSAWILRDQLFYRRVRPNSTMTSKISVHKIVSLWSFISNVLHYIGKNGMTGQVRAASIMLTNWPFTQLKAFFETATKEEIAEANQKCNNFQIPYTAFSKVIEAVRVGLTAQQELIQTQNELDRLRNSRSFRLGNALLWFPRKVVNFLRRVKRALLR